MAAAAAAYQGVYPKDAALRSDPSLSAGVVQLTSLSLAAAALPNVISINRVEEEKNVNKYRQVEGINFIRTTRGKLKGKS